MIFCKYHIFIFIINKSYIKSIEAASAQSVLDQALWRSCKVQVPSSTFRRHQDIFKRPQVVFRRHRHTFKLTKEVFGRRQETLKMPQDISRWCQETTRRCHLSFLFMNIQLIYDNNKFDLWSIRFMIDTCLS